VNNSKANSKFHSYLAILGSEASCVTWSPRASSLGGKRLCWRHRRRPAGAGSVAEGEYLRTWRKPASRRRLGPLVEVCYCDVPLAEERPIGKNLRVVRVQTARPGALQGFERQRTVACGDCDCSARLEQRLKERHAHFWKYSAGVGESAS